MHMSRWTLAACGLLLAAMAAGCGSESNAGGDDEKKDDPTAAHDASSTPARGADTADAAMKQLFDALVSGDLDTTKRLLPDAEACKQLESLPGCDQIATFVVDNWKDLTPVLAKYAGATPAQAAESIMPGAQQWNVDVPGQAPMQILVFAADGRFFAVGHVGELAPPSTGKEMPSNQVMMTREQALEVVSNALTAYGQPGADCNKIADDLSLAVPLAFDEVNQVSAPAVRALQQCALRTQRWRAAVFAGTQLLPVAHDATVVAPIVRALAEMGEYQLAFTTARDLATKYPDTKHEVMAAVVYAICKSEEWDACVKVGNEALAELAEDGAAANSEAMLATRILRDAGWIVAGQPKKALADLDELDELLGAVNPVSAHLRNEAQTAIERGYYLDIVPVPQLATGVYHLMGKSETGALLTIKLREHTGVARKLRITAHIPGVTETSSNEITVKPGQSIVRYFNPPLKMDFDVGKIRSPRPAQLALEIVEIGDGGEKTIVSETLPLDVLPRDYLPMRRRIGADAQVPTFGYLGAWVTPNAPEIDAFLAKAKQRAPNRAFVGEQNATVAQVKALYDQLKADGMTYVMDPNVTSTQSFVQRTRLPAEVLESTNAQCLEGTLLFATLMEAIGLRPIVVLVPGHAFVGWHTVPKDGTKGEPLFVETTMVGGSEFEQAVKVATERVAKEAQEGAFKSGVSTFIDVPAIRELGFSAQPI